MSELPQDIALEYQMVGQSILDGRLASYELEPADFHHSICGKAWAAMKALDNIGANIEIFSVFTQIRKDGGTSIEMSDLLPMTSGVITPYNCRPGVAELRALNGRRQAIRFFEKQIEDLREGSTAVEAFAAVEAFSCWFRTNMAATNERFVSISQIMQTEVLPELDGLASGRVEKVATGFPVLDRILGGGFSISDVALFAGLPGSGKSALVLQISRQIAAAGTPVAFLSGEMSNRENGFRLLSQEADFLNLNSVSRLNSEEHRYLRGKAEIVMQNNLPLYIDHVTSDIQTLEPQLRAMVRAKNVKVFIVDYIQLLKLERFDRRHRTERITEASQELKRIANSLEIAVIEVGQFNRDGARSAKTTMHDLEGSGQLEKDASLIFILDRDPEVSDAVTLRIEKGRNTGCGEIKGWFKAESLTFGFPEV